MTNGDAPHVDQAIEPELGEPAVESSEQSSGTAAAKLIADLRSSMVALAKAGAPRRVTIRTYGRYGFARFIAVLFSLFGYFLVLVGFAIIAVTLPGLLVDAAGQLDTGSPAVMIGSLDGVAVIRMLSGVALAWIGFFTIVSSQSARARIETADYARQSLVLRKAIAEGAVEIDTRRRSDRPAGGVEPL